MIMSVAVLSSWCAYADMCKKVAFPANYVVPQKEKVVVKKEDTPLACRLRKRTFHAVKKMCATERRVLAIVHEHFNLLEVASHYDSPRYHTSYDQVALSIISGVHATDICDADAYLMNCIRNGDVRQLVDLFFLMQSHTVGSYTQMIAYDIYDRLSKNRDISFYVSGQMEADFVRYSVQKMICRLTDSKYIHAFRQKTTLALAVMHPNSNRFQDKAYTTMEQDMTNAEFNRHVKRVKRNFDILVERTMDIDQLLSILHIATNIYTRQHGCA